jgi:3'-phosphoadenosine 5'-phosphosulfate sulfotransferase (PAPS reductase)/FAD synthetase
MNQIKAVVMYSGGICSFLAAIRAVEKFGKEHTVLLFSDTQIEDEDLYRFLREGAEYLGAELVWLKTKTMEELILKERAMPSDRMPFCSRKLKVEPAQKWCKENAPNAVKVFGITWAEQFRTKKIEEHWGNCWFPMTEPATMFSESVDDLLNTIGIKKPRLYDLGFTHNNCGGTCVRAGAKEWRHSYRVFPDRVQRWADIEEKVSEMHNKPCSILKDRRTNEPLPLTLFMDRLDKQPDLFSDDLGASGCGCFTDQL